MRRSPSYRSRSLRSSPRRDESTAYLQNKNVRAGRRPLCWLAAGEIDLSVANRRFNAVLCQLRGEPAPATCQVSARTLRLWVSRYRKAEGCFGGWYLGLLPRGRERGNRRSRLPTATQTLLLKSIENDYETLKQKTRLACWAALKRECDAGGISAPSYATFCATVRKRNRFRQVLKRLGRRAAYQHEPQYWELDRKTPRHGDRPFEIGHVDHTRRYPLSQS